MSEKAIAVQPAKQPTPIKRAASENLFERANKIFETISRRAYELFEGNGHSSGHELENWFKAESEMLKLVQINITEFNDSLEIKAEVPGFNENELEINVESRRLVISGKREEKREEKKGKTVYSETCSNEVMRVIDLPAEVETGKVSASLKNGVLEIKLPKSAKAKSIRIEPKVAA